MAGYNRVVIMGNLTRDPEYKQLASGQAVCKLGLATNRQFKNKQTGSMVQEVCYIDVDVWGAQAESCRQYLQKGRPVLVEGRIKFDSWDDANGQTRSKHSIVADRVVFLASANMAEDSAEQEVGNSRTEQQPVSAAEKELLGQIESVKNRMRTKAATKAVPAAKNNSAPMGDVAFSDEQPFTDELPF